MKVKVKSEKYLDGIFKRCFSHNPAVLFSPFFPAIWWPFYILLPFIALRFSDLPTALQYDVKVVPSWCSIASIQQSLFYSRKSGYFRYDFQSSWLDDRYKCIRVFGIFSLCKQLLKPNEVQKFFKRGEKQVLFLPTARRLVLQLLELVSKGSQKADRAQNEGSPQ